MMKTPFKHVILVLLFLAALPCSAMIEIGNLSKDRAAGLGIVMKHRANGDAGELVWLEFKKTGFLKAFTYAELEYTDDQGRHLVSARLEPHPVAHDQPEDIVSVSFSVDPAQLENCSFLIVAYGSEHGDVGYYLKVKDFLDLPLR